MKKILLVDDSLSLQTVYKLMLTDEGYEVDNAYHGQEAIDKARNTSYSLIIMDLNMPGMNGTEAIKEIRKFSNVPIIILSALHHKINKYDYTNIPCVFSKLENIRDIITAIRKYSI
jgi:DNA-binding response OmpR family regulator